MATFFYLFLFFIVSSSRDVILATVNAPPTLDPDSSSLDITKGSTLILTCTATYFLQWNTTIYGNITSRTSVRDTYDENTRLHTSKLTVFDVIYSDTGYFSCFYKGTHSDRSLGNISSIYVFVNDPENLLVPMDDFFIQLKPNTIIPCRPTSPSVNVRLYKGKNEIATDAGDVRFDNRVGFIIVYGSIFFSGTFDCVAELKNVTEKIQVVLMWISAPPKSIPKPSIDLNGNLHIAVGRTFVLTCLVNTEQESTIYFIDWDYPSKQSSRSTESEVTKRRRSSKNNDSSKDITFVQVLKNLTIEDVEKSDQGVYTCTIRDGANNSNSQQTYILVHGKDENKLSLTDDFGGKGLIEARAGDDSVQYVVTVIVHPGPPELVWMKDKRVISHTHTNKYEILHKEGQSKLIIKHLDGFDTANYTLIAKTNTLEKSITVTLWVKEPPSASIKRTMGYHVANKRYDNSIICNVKGLPLPSVKWWMAECSTIGCTKSFSREIGKSISGNMEKTTKTALDLTSVKSSLSLIAKTSAYYSCEAENSEAENPASAEYLFIVIDAELINHSGGFGIVTVNSNVLEKDRLTLECLANKFNFTVNLVWKFKKSESDQGVILTNKPGLKITNKQTQYSHGLVAQFESINLQDSGTYVCEAIGYSGNATRKKKINVLEIKAPYILTSNMDGSIYPIHREASFQFICNVTGVPIVTIEWKRDNQTLKETKLVEFNFLHNYTVLEIPRVVTEDSGIYYCVITNRAGRLVLNATLEVEDAILSSGMASQTKAIIISVIVIILILLIIFAAVLARKCYLDQKERQEIYELEKELFKKGAIERYNPDLPLEEQIDTLPYDTRWEFPREKLKLGKTLGQGAFGRVVKADAQGILQNEKSTIVAVKMLREHANVEQRKAIMQELKIMIHLGRHVNILNLLGACVQNPRRGELLIIMEYCKYGNLRNYVLRHRSNFINQINPETGEIDKRISKSATAHYSVPPPRTSTDYSGLGQDGYLVPMTPDCTQTTAVTTLNSDSVDTSDDSTGFGRLNMSMRATTASKKPLTSFDLIGYAFQTTRGMEYLASRNLIHRDLATRNILLADQNTIKISDFGLTKDCYNKAYYRKKGDAPLPVKWMAIESIRDRVFSTESDVWAFGVVLWELFSLGSNPYPGLEVDENFYKKLLCGYRMDKPEYGTDELYRIMTECWHSDPNQRPTFPELSDWIGDQLQTGMKEHYMQLNSEYLKLYQLTTANPDYVNMNADNPAPDYVNLATDETEANNSTKPDYLDMRGSNTSSMRAYEASRAAKTELKPMLSQDVPLRSKNSNIEPSVKYSANNTDSIHLMDGKNKPKNSSVPPSYNSVIADEFQV